jgi:replicative superfamily II helicase
MMKIEDLKDFGVPETVIQKLKSLGFTYLTEIQEEAVKRDLFKGKSLVISAPTNTGKTFIAELAILVTSKKKENVLFT